MAGLLVLEDDWVPVDVDFVFRVTMIADEIRVVVEDWGRVQVHFEFGNGPHVSGKVGETASVGNREYGHFGL